MKHDKNSDDIPYESLGIARHIVVWLTIGVSLWYMWWRLGTFNPEYPIFSRVLYGAEWFGFITLMLHYFMVKKLSIREAPAAEKGLSVDVFIPTYNEPAEIIRRTAINAMAMDYNHKTFILDDGNRSEIRTLASELGCEYIAREENTNSKAGNLNNALKFSTGDFVAIFDADHAPKNTFLLRTLGYFTDPEVAFVQTPQDFYNLDSYQHRVRKKSGRVWSEQSLFFRIIQRGKDMHNAAFFCGSCAIIRRSAIEAVGGIAEGTITEDLHTSIKFHKYGFKSIYHSESLALGIAPAQIEPFLKQRIRWGQGAMHVWRKEAVLFSRHLTWAQKLNYIASMIIYFDGWQKLLFYVTPVVVLVTGMMPLVTDAEQFLWHFVPFFIMSVICFEELGRGYGEMFLVEQYNMSRCIAFCYATLGLFTGKLKFKVTNKKMSGSARSYWYMLPQIIFFVANFIAIPLGLILYKTTEHLNYPSLLANMVWASFNLILAAFVIAFTSARSKFKRTNYRFSIPLVAKLKLPSGEEQYASVDDLSGAGMFIHMPHAIRLKAGTNLTGVLFLPDGPMPLEVTVRSLHGVDGKHQNEGIGCEFNWNNVSSRSRLEQFLYGSDLEWHLHGLTEMNFTLLSKSSDREHKVESLPAWSKKRNILNPAYLKNADGISDAVTAGIISYDRKNRKAKMLAFKPLPESAKDHYFETMMLDGKEFKSLRTRVANQNTPDRSLPNMYLYELESLPA